MSAYYNEFDKNAATWLRELIKDGIIADGDVDERDIRDVLPGDLRGYTQCHFFAGIGGWSAALRLAGWPDDKPVWTGSAPCQPFSAAGRSLGFADERHLWPAFHYLIEQCRPQVIFGEQVDAAIRHGWIDLVQDDLEGIGYTVEAVGLPAACIGKAHIRQRLWFVADRVPDTSSEQCNRIDALLRKKQVDPSETDWCGDVGELADAERARLEGLDGNGCDRNEPGRINPYTFGSTTEGSISLWLPCTDGKYRPVEPAPECLADGLSDSLGLVRDADTGQAFFHPLIEKGKAINRTIRLKGYGNAIVPQVAAEIIMAVMGYIK